MQQNQKTGEEVAAEVFALPGFQEGIKNLKTTSELNSFLKQLVAPALQKILEGELDHHLGYKKHEYAGRGSGNNRNGHYEKTFKGTSGPVTIDVPRDRNGTFAPQAVRKYETIDNDLEERTVSMYAKGMTTRDIAAHLADMYGVEVSDPMISTITDKVLPLVTEWQHRPLERLYAFVYLDGIVFKVRDNGKIVNKSAYIALGITEDGMKEVLGIWIGEAEGAKFWMSVLTEIQNRGVRDVLFACIDGLSGFGDAIRAVFPECRVQQCIVHQIRNTLKYVPYKDKKAFAQALKAIYRAPTEEAGYAALQDVKEQWPQYAAYLKSWETKWAELSPFFSYPEPIRRIMYTTNAIEGLNRQFRKVTKSTTIFPHDEALLKLLWLAQRDIAKKWSMTLQHWGEIISQLAILFPEKVRL
jgi:transposase-like protein